MEIRKLPRKKDWVGGRVVSLCPIANGYGSLPAGTTFEVRNSFGGLSLKSLPCRHCGFALFVRKVPESDVRYLGHPEATEGGDG